MNGAAKAQKLASPAPTAHLARNKNAYDGAAAHASVDATQIHSPTAINRNGFALCFANELNTGQPSSRPSMNAACNAP